MVWFWLKTLLMAVADTPIVIVLSVGNSFLSQQADPSRGLFMSGSADSVLLPPALKWAVFP